MLLRQTHLTSLKILIMAIGCVIHQTHAEALLKLEIEVGYQETIQSKALNQDRTVFVRLPEDYQTSNKHYPVLYLLDANDFYIGNIYHEAVTLVSRLEKLNDIPAVIIIGIQSKQWYRDAITDSKPFENYINKEVVEHVQSKYRTLPHGILVGHSYAGAFVSGAMSVDSNFNLFLALSPIYPSMAFLKKVKKRYQQLKPHSSKLAPSKLIIIDGDESPMDKFILQQTANKLDKNILDFSYLSKQLDGHMSVLTIGLSHGLREHFSDFRFPSRSLVSSKPFNLSKLKTYYAKRDKKYGSKTDDTTLRSLAISMAHRYTSMGELEQAIPFWRYGESKFKEYFMGGYAERFVALGKPELAIQLWHEMFDLFPDSDTNYEAKISHISTDK